MTAPDNGPADGDREIYDGYSVDDEDQLTPADTLEVADVDDELERGYSPPESYSAGQGYGNTPWEEEHRATIDQRIGQEIPDPDPYAETPDEDVDDGEVGTARAGRLVDVDQGSGEDTERDLVGSDVGIDGAAASAEEAAVHIIEEEWAPDIDLR